MLVKAKCFSCVWEQQESLDNAQKYSRYHTADCYGPVVILDPTQPRTTIKNSHPDQDLKGMYVGVIISPSFSLDNWCQFD